MNDLQHPPALKGPPPRLLLPPANPNAPKILPNTWNRRDRYGRKLFGLGVLMLLTATLSLGGWRHYQQHRQVIDTAVQQANFVPSVRVEQVSPRLDRLHVNLPGTTLAFEEANIYARASGY